MVERGSGMDGFAAGPVSPGGQRLDGTGAHNSQTALLGHSAGGNILPGRYFLQENEKDMAAEHYKHACVYSHFLGLQLFGALMILLNLTVFGNYCFAELFLLKWKDVVEKLKLTKAHVAKELVQL